MSSQVLVALLVTVVLLNVVQIVATQDDGALHLVRHNNARQDAAADRHVAGERALLVNVVALDGLDRSLEAETDILVPTLVLTLLGGQLGVQEDTLLLLESFLNLVGVCVGLR